MIGKSFYAKCRVLGTGHGVQRVAPVTEQPVVSRTDPDTSGSQATRSPASDLKPILSQDCHIEVLRTRLKELKRLGIVDAAIYGTKQILWERLVKCEAQYDEKLRITAVLE